MSTFTNGSDSFNGCGCGGNDTATAKALIEYANAYNNLLQRLESHMNDDVASSGVHQAREYITSIKDTLQADIDTRATRQDVGSLDRLSLTALSLVDAINDVNDLLKTKANSVDLDDYALLNNVYSKDESSNLLNQRVKIETVGLLNDLLTPANSIVEAINNLGIETNANTEMLDSFLKEYNKRYLTANAVLDFTTFHEVKLAFCGAFTGDPNVSQGLYIIGMLSETYESPERNAKTKPSTVYIKYNNSNPLTAIIDCEVTVKADGTATGAIVAKVNKFIPTVDDELWKNLKFHIVKGTNGDGKTVRYYLAMSAKNMHRKDIIISVAGINFYPIGYEDYVTFNADAELLKDSTVSIPDNETGTLSANSLSTNTLLTGAYADKYGHKLFESEEYVDELDGLTKYRLYIADPAFTEVLFRRRPKINTAAEGDPDTWSDVASLSDLSGSVTVPTGAIIRWGAYDKSETGEITLKNYPASYLPCDGRKLNKNDYTELANVLIPDAEGKITLPIEDFSVIKVK